MVPRMFLGLAVLGAAGVASLTHSVEAPLEKSEFYGTVQFSMIQAGTHHFILATINPKNGLSEDSDDQAEAFVYLQRAGKALSEIDIEMTEAAVHVEGGIATFAGFIGAAPNRLVMSIDPVEVEREVSRGNTGFLGYGLGILHGPYPVPKALRALGACSGDDPDPDICEDPDDPVMGCTSGGPGSTECSTPCTQVPNKNCSVTCSGGSKPDGDPAEQDQLFSGLGPEGYSGPLVVEGDTFACCNMFECRCVCCGGEISGPLIAPTEFRDR